MNQRSINVLHEKRLRAYTPIGRREEGKMRLLPLLVCAAKGHRLELAYYRNPTVMDFAFLHYGLVSECRRCGEVVSVDESCGLPVRYPDGHVEFSAVSVTEVMPTLKLPNPTP